MAEHARENLQKFALHIQLTANECEDASAVARRYIALHVNVVPTSHVYSAIASDYKVVELRTHNPPIKSYAMKANVDIPTYVYVMQTIPDDTVRPAKRLEAFTRFSEELFPRPKGEERYKYITRPNQWKEKATFVALNFKNSANLLDLMETLHGKAKATDMFKRVRSYQDPKAVEMQQDFSEILKQIAIPAEDMVLLSKAQLPAPQPPIQVAAPVEVLPMAKVLVTKTSVASKTLDDIRPSMEAYRKRAGLNATVSTTKIAKQMLYAALGTPVSNLPDGVLGTFQKELTPLKIDEVSVALDSIDAFQNVELDANSSAYLVALATLSKQYEWNTRDLLRNAIGNWDERVRTRLAKAHPQGLASDPVVISAIANLK
jgi:hypothetical protein